MVAEKTILWYPDYNKKLIIYIDASESQLGVIVSQYRWPLAFCQVNMINKAQQNYTTTDKIQLSIVKTLKDVCTIFHSQYI